MTLADLASEPERAPATTLLHLWFAIQWWDEPAILAAYAPDVTEALGASTVAAAWDSRRGSVLGSRLRIVETTRSRDVAVVTFTRESRSSPPGHESATMVREPGGWRILHDTTLEDALAGRPASRRFRALALTGTAKRRR